MPISIINSSDLLQNLKKTNNNQKMFAGNRIRGSLKHKEPKIHAKNECKKAFISEGTLTNIGTTCKFRRINHFRNSFNTQDNTSFIKTLKSSSSSYKLRSRGDKRVSMLNINRTSINITNYDPTNMPWYVSETNKQFSITNPVKNCNKRNNSIILRESSQKKEERYKEWIKRRRVSTKLQSKTYMYPIKTIITENKGKIYVGTEYSFPEISSSIISFPLKTKKAIFDFIENYSAPFRRGFQLYCAMKISFNSLINTYSVFLYSIFYLILGNQCFLSICCNSLIAFRFSKDSCKITCLNKDCTMPLIDITPTTAELRKVLRFKCKDIGGYTITN